MLFLVHRKTIWTGLATSLNRSDVFPHSRTLYSTLHLGDDDAIAVRVQQRKLG